MASQIESVSSERCTSLSEEFSTKCVIGSEAGFFVSPPPPLINNNGDHMKKLDSIKFFSDFILFCKWLVSFKPNWKDWVPNTDIREKLSPQALDRGQEILWKQSMEDENFEALLAAESGDENVVALAVLIAPNHKILNTMNCFRQTLLHKTTSFCSAKLSRLLITRGADGAIPDVWGDTPLHIAARHGRADVVTALTLALTKPEVKHPYYKCPFKSLPQDNVNSLNHDGRAPIHLAAETPFSLEHRETIAALHVYAKCNMNIRRLGDGYSPAHIAIDNEDLYCLQVCLEAESDSEVRNFKGETPFQLAFLCKDNHAMNLCHKFGAGLYQLDHADTEPIPMEHEGD